MAYFLIKTGAFPGHVSPTVPIVQKLIERSHEVVWITGRDYRHQVEATGARFEPMPKQDDPNGRDIYEMYPELGRLKGVAQIKWWIKHVFLDACEREIEAINSIIKTFPADVLVGDSITFGLYFRSEMGGPPSACISLLPDSLPSPDTAPWGMGLCPSINKLIRIRNQILNFLMYRILLRDIDSYANKVRYRLGLEPYNESFFTALPLKMSLIMQISTPAFEYYRGNEPWYSYSIGPIIPEKDHLFEPPQWFSDLDGPESVVLVNQGTIANDINDLIIPTIEGLKNQDKIVVAVPVKADQLGVLPKHVRAEPFIPFDHLFPHVDVMVTNGGYGGTQWALSHGIPLVVAGGTEDKMEVATRAEWSGAGINLKKQRPSPTAISKAVNKVLNNPSYQENARRIQADFAKYNAPLRASELLEALACDELNQRH